MNRSFCCFLCFLVTATIVPVVSCLALGHPKPAAAPYRWELKFESGPFRLYLDPDSNEAYWYFTYKVTNRTDKTQMWAPRLVLYTDHGEILPAGKDVSLRVRQSLMWLLNNQLLQDQNAIIGEIKPGREFALEGLVIWPATKLDVNEVSLFVGGISGETARVTNPATGKRVILQKTLQRDYLIRGNALARVGEELELIAQEWILR